MDSSFKKLAESDDLRSKMFEPLKIEELIGHEIKQTIVSRSGFGNDKSMIFKFILNTIDTGPVFEVYHERKNVLVTNNLVEAVEKYNEI